MLFLLAISISLYGHRSGFCFFYYLGIIFLKTLFKTTASFGVRKDALTTSRKREIPMQFSLLANVTTDTKDLEWKLKDVHHDVLKKN